MKRARGPARWGKGCPAWSERVPVHKPKFRGGCHHTLGAFKIRKCSRSYET